MKYKSTPEYKHTNRLKGILKIFYDNGLTSKLKASL